MRTIPLTQFRQHACELLTEVEGGETIEITRHGRVIAEIRPKPSGSPSWERPHKRVRMKDGSLASDALLEDRYADRQ